MKLYERLLPAFIIFLALAHGVYGVVISGGGSAEAGAESLALGGFSADDAGAASVVDAFGSIPYAGELRFVQDITGRRAEMSFKVTGASGSIG